MAFTGVHITFGPTRNDYGQDTLAFTTGCFSQTMASAGTTGANPNNSVTLLEISASAPIFFAVGPNPDATNGVRRYMDPANGSYDMFANPGDKVAWIFA